MQKNTSQASTGAAAKIGALLFVIWGILHIWVGYEGSRLFINEGAKGLWDFYTGGSKVPHGVFQHSTDAGVLGLFVAWMIWRQASWVGFFIGVFVIGICDLTFLFVTLMSGVVELNLPTVIGPILWFLAVAITPFGLPKSDKSRVN